ncbi:diiron oxygenase [Mycobacterium sp. CSUR Q5927]|nr:diiron oxygenase [Mycobacterium sp. CSUR Q5927]
MPIWLQILGLLGSLLVVGLVSATVALAVARYRRTMDVSDDPQYTATLQNLSQSSVRRRFDPFTDIDWDAPENAITADDPRWVLTDDPLGRTDWYRSQPLDKQIAIGMWRQANIAKVTLQFESMLIRGLVQYASRVPNGSPEHRYCMHESVEECNHVLMFQELVNRIGFDVPGMQWWMRWLSPLMPLYAGPFPNVFFFGVLAGEVPVDVIQTNALREAGSGHPVVEKVMAIHIAEEARHISFADAYLRKRVPKVWRINRLWMSVYVPFVMRLLAKPMVVPPRSFFRQFEVPRSVRKQLRSGSPESQQALRDTFADIRMLCDDIGLMTLAGRLMWRICKIDGAPSRYRGEPQRAQVAVQVTGVKSAS